MVDKNLFPIIAVFWIKSEIKLYNITTTVNFFMADSVTTYGYFSFLLKFVFMEFFFFFLFSSQ